MNSWSPRRIMNSESFHPYLTSANKNEMIHFVTLENAQNNTRHKLEYSIAPLNLNFEIVWEE